MPLPGQAVTGMVFYDQASASLHLFTGSKWVPLSGMNNTIQWFLFIDDLREPIEVGWQSGRIEIARSSQEAKDLVDSLGLPTQISFDHDLGGDDTAFKFMWYLINGHLDEKWNLGDIQVVYVHTANSVGRDKLVALWRGFCKSAKLEVPVVVKQALAK